MAIAQSLDRAVSKALMSRKAEPRYRVFKNTGLDYVLCRKIPDVWERGEETSHKQLNRHAGPNTCLAVNDIAAWDAELGVEIRRTLEASGVLNRFSNPRIVDTYTFISSSSGWTPFGAHVDFEHSLILGISGAERTIYTWDIGTDIGQLKSDASSFLGLSFDYEGQLGSARKVDLKPGDLSVIEAMEGHVFYANGGGMFIGVSCVESDLEANTYGPELAPSKDPEVADFLNAQRSNQIRWSNSAKIHENKISNGHLEFMASPEAVNIARLIKTSLDENDQPTLENFVKPLKGKSINVTALVKSCAQIGAIYLP